MSETKEITTSSGEKVTVRETVDSVTVSASRKIQLDRYEPIETFVGLDATKPSELDGIDKSATLNPESFDEWLEGLADLAMAEAEQAAMRRHEEYVREESFSDD